MTDNNTGSFPLNGPLEGGPVNKTKELLINNQIPIIIDICKWILFILILRLITSGVCYLFHRHMKIKHPIKRSLIGGAISTLITLIILIIYGLLS